MIALTVALIACMVVADAASDVLVARAMKQIGEVTGFRPRALFATFGRMARTPSFVAGIGAAAIHFFTFLALLSFVGLSYVFPATALVYVLATAGAQFILKEHVSARRWAGVCLVCGGMALVSMS
jgi:drug/metabolite transporter (DMT)-like permease